MFKNIWILIALFSAPLFAFDSETEIFPEQLFQQAHPPRSENMQKYPYFPGTDYTTMNISALNRGHDGVRDWAFVWANRSQADSKQTKNGNYIYPPIQQNTVKAFYTSYDKADFATYIQICYLLNLPDSYIQNVAKNHDLQILTHAEALNHIVDGKITDIVILPNARLSDDADGVVVDYEVQDSRTPAHTLAFIRKLSERVHKSGKKIILFTNPLNAPTMKATAIPPNADRVLNLVDGLSIFLWFRNKEGDIEQSYKNQIAVIEGECGPDCNDYEKLVIVFQMSETTVWDAEYVRNQMEKDGIPNLMIWRHYAKPDYDPDSGYSQKMQALISLDQLESE